MGNNIGLLEYASLLKTQKNPYERAISTEAAVMNAMPKDGGFTGLEGIGKIPLMYAMGRDTANAQAFDQQQDEGVAGYIKQRQELEQQQLRKQAQLESMKNYIAIAKEDPAAANQLATTDPLLKDSPFGGLVLKEKVDKNNWLSLDQLNEDGTVKTTYHVNLQGLKTAEEKLAAEGIDNPTIEQIHANMPAGFSIKTEGAAKAATEAKDPKLTGHVVRDRQSATGWSYAGEDGTIMATGAPDPYKGKESTGGNGGGADGKEFRQWTSKLDGLRKAEASIQKGFDPITGQIIPQTQIDAALRTVRSQIADTEGYISTEYPDQWKKYRKPAPAQQPPQGRQLDPKTAAEILRDAGGDKEKARQMARGLGFTF